MLPFAAAVFIGAFLLFLVQPLMGKFVLPWFGGTPAVWTTCLLFFQTALLAGYGYAHLLTTTCRPVRQVWIHTTALLVVALGLPPTPAASWKTMTAAEPLVQLLSLLIYNLGPVFVVLSATGPLLQRWFATVSPGPSPYRLYALSNAGSLLALIAYPLVVEPTWDRESQGWGWSIGFLGFILVCLWSGSRVWLKNRTESGLGETRERDVPLMTLSRITRLGWLCWPGVASALLVSTTTALTLDVAAVPFLWVVPLAVYLLSFIITFEHSRWYWRKTYIGLAVIMAAATADLLMAGSIPTFWQTGTTLLAGLFVACMVCHGELYRARPAAARLTHYYLHIAGGGALGSLSVAVLAPLFFDRYVELPVAWAALLLGVVAAMLKPRSVAIARAIGFGGFATLFAIPLFRAGESLGTGGSIAGDAFASCWDFWQSNPMLTLGVAVMSTATLLDREHFIVRTWRTRSGVLASIIATGAAVGLLHFGILQDAHAIVSERNFHGVLTVSDYNADVPRAHSRYLSHGSTTHGIQLRHPDNAQYPTSYYAPEAGIGRALSRANQTAGRNIGVVGLGVGTLAAYGQSGDTLRFYEINPAVVRLARTHFNFLEHTAAGVEITEGDGRLLLEQEATGDMFPRFDILVLDAFSSDAVPIHLLTREAFDTYLARLTPTGLLVINVSNRLVDLAPVVTAHAAERGLWVASIYHAPAPDDWWSFPSEWMLLSRSSETLKDPLVTEVAAVDQPASSMVSPWTDSHASVLPILR